jgi:hypothetical protein
MKFFLYLILIASICLTSLGCSTFTATQCNDVVNTCSIVAQSICLIISSYPANNTAELYTRDSIAISTQISLIESVRSKVFLTTLSTRFLNSVGPQQASLLASYATLDSLSQHLHHKLQSLNR